MSLWRRVRRFVGAAAGFALGGPAGAAIGYQLGAGRDAERKERQQHKQAQAAVQQGTAAQLDEHRLARESYERMQQQALAETRTGREQALAETRAGREQALAMQLSGAQTSYDLQRQLARQDPRARAQLGALQTMPRLQAALGMPAYNIPTRLPELPDINFAQNFINTMAQTGGRPAPPRAQTQQASPGTLPPEAVEAMTQEGIRITPQGAPLQADAQTGVRASPRTRQRPAPVPVDAQAPISLSVRREKAMMEARRQGVPIEQIQGRMITEPEKFMTQYGPRAVTPPAPPPQPQLPPPATPPQDEIGAELTPYTGGFDVAASPLYQWQLQETTDALRNQLAAQGLGMSTYGQREESRLRAALSAQERERQVANMFQMVNLGMGFDAAPMHQMAAMPQGMGGNIANIASHAAAQAAGIHGGAGRDIAGIYSGMGTGLAQSHINRGAIAAQGMYGQAQLAYNRPQQRDLLAQGLEAFGQYKQLQDVFRNPVRRAPPAFVPTYRQQVATMPGMGIPIY